MSIRPPIDLKLVPFAPTRTEIPALDVIAMQLRALTYGEMMEFGAGLAEAGGVSRVSDTDNVFAALMNNWAARRLNREPVNLEALERALSDDPPPGFLFNGD